MFHHILKKLSVVTRWLAFCLLLGLSACSTTRELPELSEKRGRLIFEPIDRAPFRLDDRLFGRFTLVEDSNKNVIFRRSKTDHRDAQTTFLDLDPGVYNIKAECENLQAFRGHRFIRLVSEEIKVEANRSVILACDLVKVKDKKSELGTQRTPTRGRYKARLIQKIVD